MQIRDCILILFCLFGALALSDCSTSMFLSHKNTPSIDDDTSSDDNSKIIIVDPEGTPGEYGPDISTSNLLQNITIDGHSVTYSPEVVNVGQYDDLDISVDSTIMNQFAKEIDMGFIVAENNNESNNCSQLPGTHHFQVAHTEVFTVNQFHNGGHKDYVLNRSTLAKQVGLNTSDMSGRCVFIQIQQEDKWLIASLRYQFV